MIGTDFIENTKLIEQGRDLNDWYVFRDQKHYGPFSYQALTEYIKDDVIHLSHYVWRPGFKEWIKIEDLNTFSCLQDKEMDRKRLTDDDFYSLIKEDLKGNESIDFVPPSVNEGVTANGSVKANNKNYIVALGALISLTILGLSYIYFNAQEDLYSYSLLSVEQQNKLQIISETPAQGLADIRVQTYLSKINTGDPVIIFGTNLPANSNLRYSISGVGGTLIGMHRYNETFNIKVPEDKIFESKPLRRASGEFIPAGVYKLSISCAECAKGTSFDEEIKFFPRGEVQYKKDLQQFNDTVRYNTSLELNELKDILRNVRQQFNETIKGFNQNKSLAVWDDFSKAWLVNQEELINLFSQLKNDDLRDKIKMISMYDELQTIVRNLFEMHMLQDDIRRKKITKVDYKKLSKRVSDSINAFESALNIEKLNLNKTEFISGR